MRDFLENYKNIILKIIGKHLPKCKVYLFGSRARKTNLEGADIDIALNNGKLIDQKTLFAITNEVDESSLPIFVDIVDFHMTSDDMKKQILKDKVEWKS